MQVGVYQQGVGQCGEQNFLEGSVGNESNEVNESVGIESVWNEKLKLNLKLLLRK